MASLAEALAQTFLPSTCAACGDALPWQGSRAGVCAACWIAAAPHAGRLCPVCGETEVVEDGPCLACRNDPPRWRAAASFGPYSGRLRDLVLLLKTRGRDELAPPLAELLVAVARGAGWPHPDAVVAVPMAWWRRFRRGYNQAELIARVVSRRLGAPLLAPLGRRGGRSQVGLARSERLRLGAGAFPVRRRIRGRVYLVDDVLTTGATAAACSRALVAAGAAEVFVLTVATTPRSGRIP
ncbi:MAG: ComF family protein [Thermoanaerobaculales bacterium]